MNSLKISVVTPSYNQGQYLEETIKTIMSQDHKNVEYIIVDGGSRDNSIDIIKRYAADLFWWVSEPDNGRGDSLNKGFSHSTGEIMAWLGCGDAYFPWTFKVVSEIFATFPEMEWLTTGIPSIWYDEHTPCFASTKKGYSREGFLDGKYLPWRDYVQQESTFWRRSLWDRAGGFIDSKRKDMPDLELWLRFCRFADLYSVSIPLGGFRIHGGQKEKMQYYWSVGRAIYSEKLREYKISEAYRYTRYLISKLPMLRLIVKSDAFNVHYDHETQKWVKRITKV